MKACVLNGIQKIYLKNQDKPILTNNTDVLIEVKYAGICGSDLHYYQHGANGTFIVQHPYILGHEASGQIVDVGNDVQDLKQGDLVAIDPNISCKVCESCRKGKSNLCVTAKLMGSASVVPHLDGVFRDYIVVDSKQCYKASSAIDVKKLALAEPLAVVLHALSNELTDMLGKKVLIMGAGTIGSLAIQVCKLRGASEIVVIEPNDIARNKATLGGASYAISPNEIDSSKSLWNYFDIAIEASGVVSALNQSIKMLKKSGNLFQIGMFKDEFISLAMSEMIAKEIKFVGSFRTANEFPCAVELLEKKFINTDLIISHIFDSENIERAFETALDKTQAMKVLIKFNE